jgi:hypothetical protein
MNGCESTLRSYAGDSCVGKFVVGAGTWLEDSGSGILGIKGSYDEDPWIEPEETRVGERVSRLGRPSDSWMGRATDAIICSPIGLSEGYLMYDKWLFGVENMEAL